MASKYNYEGKVALITGSSSGIGEAVALQLAQYGAHVTITGRSSEALAQVAEKIQRISGRKPLQIVGDLTEDLELPKKLIDSTISEFGQLDVLVNNAGATTPKRSLLDPEIMSAYDTVFQLNVRTALELIRLAVPYLEKTSGNIVNISSLAGIRPFFPVYSMSKAALDMLSKTAAQELGPKGIRVNSVNPGPVKTRFFRSAGMDLPEAELNKIWDDLASKSVLKRIPLAEDVANLVSFVASNHDAANITGSIMLTDTGFNVKNPMS